MGLLVRPNPVCGRNLYHPDYDALWAAIEALGRPVCLHDGSSPRLPSYGDRLATHTSGHILSHPFEAMAAMMSLIWYGVVARHPGLRFIHFEADGGWVPYWLQRMEQHYHLYGCAEHPGASCDGAACAHAPRGSRRCAARAGRARAGCRPSRRTRR